MKLHDGIRPFTRYRKYFSPRPMMNIDLNKTRPRYEFVNPFPVRIACYNANKIRVSED